MKWFEGSINEAVATSKSKKAIFVVFVEGKDDTSMEIANAINTSEVSSRLEQEAFVVIRLESGSETYRFFAQIYQLVPVPSIFFIGENGAPLEIIAGSATPSELASKIDSVLIKAGKHKVDASTNLIEAEQANTVSADIVANTSSNATASSTLDDTTKMLKPDIPSGKENVVIDKADTNEESSANAITEQSSSTQLDESATTSADTKQDNKTKELSPEEKLERAKLLIEQQRRQRVEEEQRKARERELERRRMGRDVQKMRQKQQDMEVKQAHEERMKEKAAEAAAREKVRQQIAQDKLERKQKELALQQQAHQQQSQSSPKARVTPILTDTTIARIQFKLPTGNPHMGQFKPTNTVRDMRSYVVENIDLPFHQFTMSTSFPRRELSSEDDNKTLLELELVPTAVILILPVKTFKAAKAVTSAQEVGFISRFMWTIFAPIIGIYNYIRCYFSGEPRRNTRRQRSDSPEAADATSSSNEAVLPHLQNAAQSAGLYRRNLNIQGGATIRSQGNIHRLHSAGDDNDENNTWNGNSTQQM